MKFGRDIDDGEQWLSKYLNFVNHFHFQVIPVFKYSDYIILHNLAWH